MVNASSLIKEKDIKVKLNPAYQCLTGADGYVYVVSQGNYAGTDKIPEEQWIYQTLQRIDPATDKLRSCVMLVILQIKEIKCISFMLNIFT